MRASLLSNALFGWFRRRFASDQTPVSVRRGRRDHVIILDGTMSSLEPGCETNAGLLYRMLQEIGGDLSVYYESGLQWEDWRSATHIMTGRGINRQICRAYGFLASRYRPGDRVFFFGYSRGAFAVRSLAGVIDQIGLLRAECATERNIRQAYRLYRHTQGDEVVQAFVAEHCHPETKIEAVCVWDTVKALGWRMPVLWRLSENQHAFHNDQLGPSIQHGFHALAYHEKRMAYAPVLWSCPPGWSGHVEQVWFKGVHGDIGGQLRGYDVARPLANIPLVWMLDRAEAVGLPLPDGWRNRFPQDVMAPSLGGWRGWSKVFWHRKQRSVGTDASERVHETLELPQRQDVSVATAR